MRKVSTIRFAVTALVFLLALMPTVAMATFDSGSTGVDGALVVEPGTVELQLPPDGVFNYTTVLVKSGAILKFRKNEKNTPVTILAQGDVLIQGTIDVNGLNGAATTPGAGGPGGFSGAASVGMWENGRNGEGPGGGTGGGKTTSTNGSSFGGHAGGAGYALAGGAANGNVYGASGAGGTAYGSERLLPLVGGSGGGSGGGNTNYAGYAGGGGGGALLIASSTSISVTGGITANGGASSGNTNAGAGGGGSGGCIRLIANTISGTGSLQARGGVGGYGYSAGKGGDGSIGRIRLEASTLTGSLSCTPAASIGTVTAINPPAMPSLSIVSVGGVAVPSLTSGSFSSPDITLPFSTQNPVSVVVSAANVPVGTQVTVTAHAASGASSSASALLSGSEVSSTASVDLNLFTAYPSVLTASVTFELLAANGGHFLVDGEMIAKVRVSTDLGGDSSVTYITASGREVPAHM